MMSFIRTLVVAMLMGSLACKAEVENLLPNGDFSKGLEGWRNSVEADAVTVMEDAGEGHVLQATVAGTSSGLGQIWQRVPIKQNTRYQLSGRLKGNAKDQVMLQIKKIRAGKEQTRLTAKSKTANAWEEVSKRFDSGDADELIILCRYSRKEPFLNSQAFFSSIILKELGELLYEGPEVEPRAVPTFHSVGLYWKPVGGGPSRVCTVQYREKGTEAWQEALPLWCDPNEHDGAEAHTLEYRGSIVHLKPGTAYEARLHIADIDREVSVPFTTLSETFPIARTVTLPSAQKETYVISEGGSPETGYVLYTPAVDEEAVWDAENESDVHIQVKASWVIIQGLELKNARKHGIELLDVDHVVIQNCDISGWGQSDPRDGYGINLHSAIYSQSTKLSDIIVQYCELHHPRSDSNSWREKLYSGGSHPRGPQAICFKRGQGGYIIRYNRFYSDLDHMFNDAIGETKNFSFAGFPNRDSDIYGNFVSHCWDDGLEIEGANMNVRVWDNYIDYTWGAIGAASPSLGPVYFWRNVYGVSRAGITTDASGYRGHYLFKLGNENLRWVKGKMYIFHNTALQPPAYAGHTAPSGAQSGIVFTSNKKQAQNITSRNNVLHVRLPNSPAVRDTQLTASNDFDYDLYNGRIQAKEGSETNGIVGEPTYERAPDGRLWLAPGTLGHDAGVRIPNFNDDFVGAAPDMGAIETGTSSLKPETWPTFPEPAKAVEKDEMLPPAPAEPTAASAEQAAAEQAVPATP